MRITLPFGNGTTAIAVPKKHLAGVVKPSVKKTRSLPLKQMAREALHCPTGSKPLVNIASPCHTVALVVTDTTRPCPDHIFVPLILRQLAQAGVPAKNITIIVATGLHRPLTKKEIRQKLGGAVAKAYAVVNHNPRAADLAYLGKTKRGCPIYINPIVRRSSLVIATGVIEPHQWAGYSGARKSIAIGTAGEETIAWLHRPAVFDHAKTRLGNLRGNMFHATAQEIAHKTNLAFIVAGVVGPQGAITRVVAGHPDKAFYAGAACADPCYRAYFNKPADIVITGLEGSKSSNIYQATRAVTYALFSPSAPIKEGGAFIVPAACPEGPGKGTGEQRFFKLLCTYADPSALVRHARAHGYPGGAQRAYITARVLEHAKIVFAGIHPRWKKTAERMGFKAYTDVQDAIDKTIASYGPAAQVLVVPHALQTLMEKKQ